ncbi:acyltransferase domain-containing protein [Streptomyces sp. M19]
MAEDREGFLLRLGALADGEGVPGLVHHEGPGHQERESGPAGRIAFVFPGQGAQWPGMTRDLLAYSPAFAERVDACAQALEPFLDWAPMDVIRGADGAPDLERADVVQPVLFAIGLGLVALWEEHGVRPGALLGHSVGRSPPPPSPAHCPWRTRPGRSSCGARPSRRWPGAAPWSR